ncbi:MAG: 16S rRNA (adenine(1518)-N(6)/adenine(1519)-N(6))-dimethyltransferase RsmA [Actinomycetota bacterium]
MGPYISTPKETLKIIEENNIRLKKNFGQNFLVDTNIGEKIIGLANIKGCRVLEVGCGIGNLTQLLIRESKKVICIELDYKLSQVFKKLFSAHIGDKIILIEGDALKFDYKEIEEKYGVSKIVSNLPYKIAAPLLLKVFREAKDINEGYVTIQKDIADRIQAEPKTKDYGAYTVKANVLADYNIEFIVSRNCFIPKPNVDSAVVKILKNLKLDGKNVKGFFSFVDGCFAHRRKKLLNSLKNNKAFGGKIGLVQDILKEMGKSKSIRGEELTIKEYIYLYENLISYI